MAGSTTTAGSLPSLNQRRAAFVARSAVFARFGYDREAAATHVATLVPVTDGQVLDVGTGKGQLAIAMARRGLTVVSVDPDAGEQELAALLATEAGVSARIQLRSMDAAILPDADGAFAAAAMMDVLHHLADPFPVLREMARVVRPGGVMVLADFDEEGFALVARVHREEGRDHPRSWATVDRAYDELHRRGWGCLTVARAFMHQVVVATKPARTSR